MWDWIASLFSDNPDMAQGFSLNDSAPMSTATDTSPTLSGQMGMGQYQPQMQADLSPSWGDKLGNFAYDSLNKSTNGAADLLNGSKGDFADRWNTYTDRIGNQLTGGMLDAFNGKLQPTKQSDNPVENVMAGSNKPSYGQLYTDLKAGNYGSALGNLGAMARVNDNSKPSSGSNKQSQQSPVPPEDDFIAKAMKASQQQGANTKQQSEQSMQTLMSIIAAFA